MLRSSSPSVSARVRRWAAVAGVALVVTACSGDGAERPSATDTQETPGSTAATTGAVDSRPGLAAGEDFSVAAALGEIPDALFYGAAIIVGAGDLDAATAVAGTERPTSDDAEDFTVWANSITARGAFADRGAFVALPQLLLDAGLPTDPAAYEAALGWSIRGADAFVGALQGSGELAVVTGDFDADTLADELVSVGKGVVSLGDGDDLEQDLQEPTPLNRFGYPTRLATRGRAIALSPLTDPVVDWLDGTGGTLAEYDDLIGVADVLDEEGVYSAIVARADFGEFRSVPEAMFTAIAPHLAQDPFTAVGLGWVDDDTSSIVVWRFADAATAAANEAVLADLVAAGTTFSGASLSDALTLESIETSGPHVILRATPVRTSVTADLFVRQDVPFVYVD